MTAPATITDKLLAKGFSETDALREREMTVENLAAHYALAAKWQRLKYLEKHCEKAEPGEIARLREELGRG